MCGTVWIYDCTSDDVVIGLGNDAKERVQQGTTHDKRLAFGMQ